MASSLLVLGGARSGKSRHAVRVQPARARVTFVGTAQARDADMTARIARHRAERPAAWATVDAPLDLVPRVKDALATSDAVVVDCLTLWVSNLMLRGDRDDAILAEAGALAALVGRSAVDVTLVSNEVGEGVHPMTAEGRRFRDLLGLVNQMIAAACDRVVLMVAGLQLNIKETQERPDVTLGQAP